MKFNNTYKEFTKISKLIIKDLRNQLKEQKHIASGKLSRSFTGVQEKISGDNIILNITSSKDYWRVVNDPNVAFTVNKQNIIRWVNKKGLDRNFANAIYKRLARGIYGKEKEKYVYWKEGNNIQRTNFAGIVAKENSQKIGEELAQLKQHKQLNKLWQQIQKR
jgi:hypothetical protein